MFDKTILLIIAGGIAAFKSLDLIRRLREKGVKVVPVLTKGGAEFVTPLSVSSLAGHKVYQDLFDLTDEAEMGHIELSRAADLVVVAPATADLMSKMAQGAADDLASTLLLATDKDTMVVPAMNVRMWMHPATQRNVETLKGDGVLVVGPDEGSMACGEFGPGRLAEVPDILDAIDRYFQNGPLVGKHIVVTSGPTHEPIDPVRYIANRSSGTQGTALAAALRYLGADVTFITGPARVPPPQGVHVIPVTSARDMLEATQNAMPADALICAAAVADWRVASATDSKIKKDAKGTLPSLEFTENPDILATMSRAENRPELVVGFAAETDDVLENAKSKLARKGCDWIVANDVSPETGIMGGSMNRVTVIGPDGADSWDEMTKDAVAEKLANLISMALT